MSETNKTTLSAQEKATQVASWLEDKQARDILALDLQGLSEATDCMIIATARNVRHAQALADHVLHEVADMSWEMLGMEGYKTGQWVLVDLNDVVVHVFQPKMRDYFNLEGLWAKAEAFIDSRDHKDASQDDDDED